jgi:hypothetical protein
VSFIFILKKEGYFLMANYRIIKIDIKDLLVNVYNPRFDPVEAQHEAISEMVLDQNDKLYRLAIDILQSGLNPSDLPIVSPYLSNEEKYVVLEGNRRVTTLKILHNPELIKSKQNLHSKFCELRESYSQNIITSIDCVVFGNDEDAYHWIDLKHTGEKQGIGTVRWNATQVKRFQISRGKSSVALQLLEYSKRLTFQNPEVSLGFDSISITNLERLIGDPLVRNLLGIEIDKGKIYCYISESEFQKGLQKIISDLSLKRINVNDIRSKSDRAKYIENFKSYEIPNNSEPYEESWLLSNKNIEGKAIDAPTIFDFSSLEEEDSIDSSIEYSSGIVQQEIENKNELEQEQVIKHEEVNQSVTEININNTEGARSTEINSIPKQRSIRLSTKRKGLIPSGCILKIDHPRINQIYRELKSLNVDDYTNSAAILLRVFLELSLDHFIESEEIQNVDIDKPLITKIQKTADFFLEKKILTKHQLKPVRTSISTTDNILSTNTLNAYVHNKDFIPKATELKITWDNLQKFVESLWKKED